MRLPRAQPVEAVFRGWEQDLMLLSVEGMAQDWPVSIYDMAWLEVHTERTRREGLRHHAVLGAVTGLFVGAGIGLGLHAIGVTGDPEGPPEQVIQAGLRGAGLGTLAGFIGGGIFGGRNPGVGWVSLSLPVPSR